MADDGIQGEGMKRPGAAKPGAETRGAPQAGADAKGGRAEESGDRGKETLPAALQDGDPAALPPYKDPKGRRITPLQKRRAMRAATALGIKPSDANHALHIAAENGIDVFSNAMPSMLALAARSREESSGALAVLQDPAEHNILAKRPGGRNAPVPVTEIERRAAVERIQLNLVRRRRRRLRALMLRLMVFVFLPTAAVGYYFYNIATDMFATDSEFVIQTSENPAMSGGLGGLLAGTGFATSQDSIVVQGYLSSREAFNRLDQDFGYVEHFQDPSIDVIQRLPADATADQAYDYYKDKVIIGYDPTEGIIRMTVIAATPDASQKFAEALVGYAEERVDGLTRQARGDQLRIAEERYREAEEAMLAAERRVLELQQRRGVMSAEAEYSSQMSIINALELEAENKRLALAELMDNPRPNETRAEVQRREIERIEARIAELRRDLTHTSDNSVSLAMVGGELRIAETALATRHLILQESVAAMEAARLEANRQVRYLSMGVAPVAPIEPSYPRKLESTLLAFFIFGGIYILVSLTVSILREQVSV